VKIDLINSYMDVLNQYNNGVSILDAETLQTQNGK
jgi:hypothetical protein